jgi:hypothetical protein
MAVNPCTVLDALSDFQYDLMRRLNKKFEQLRRLAALLEQLGDLSSLIPNLNALIPILNIDFSVYEALAQNCPFLGLPTNPIQGELDKLRQQVLAAYDNYARQLLNHPFLRMGKLQEEMTKFQTQLTGALSQGQDFIRCLQAMCAAGSALGSAVSKLSQAEIEKTVTKFTENFVTNAGQVLTDPMKQKYGQVTDALGTMQDLGSDVGKDYSYYSNLKLLTFTGQTTATATTGKTYSNPPFVDPAGELGL